VNNIKTDIKEKGDDVKRIHLTQDWGRWQALVELCGSIKDEELLE
jgi:hypothetical protein